MIDRPALPLRRGGQEHFLNNLRDRCRGAFHRAGERVATERAKPNRSQQRNLAGVQSKTLVIDHEQQAIALDRWPRRRKIQGHDWNAFKMDVLPDVELGPIGERKNSKAFTFVLAGIINIPQLWTLILWVPTMIGGTKRKDALLGAGLLFIAASAAECTSKPYSVSACFNPSVFQRSVCSEP